MSIRFCDDRGEHGFSWIVDDPMTRTSHALAADGHVWIVDPVRHQPALERAMTSARRSLSSSFSIGTTVTARRSQQSSACRTSSLRTRCPARRSRSSVREARGWRRIALWWPVETLVVAEAVGTNRSSRAAGIRRRPPSVRLIPPRAALGAFEAEHARRSRRRHPRRGSECGSAPRWPARAPASSTSCRASPRSRSTRRRRR